jgi:hypothetical protein
LPINVAERKSVGGTEPKAADNDMHKFAEMSERLAIEHSFGNQLNDAANNTNG